MVWHALTTIVTNLVHPAPEFPSDLFLHPKLLIQLNNLDNTCVDKLNCLPPLCLLLCLSHNLGTGALQGTQDGFSGPSCLPFLVTWGQISREHMDAANLFIRGEQKSKPDSP